jgi:hypothetical protein
MNKKRLRTQRRMVVKSRAKNTTHVQIFIAVTSYSRAGVEYNKFKKAIVPKKY